MGVVFYLFKIVKYLMTLSEWLSKNKLTYTEFAKLAGLPRAQYAWKYATGIAVPSVVNMKLIFRATNGAVTPNDFYGLGTDNAQTVAAAQAAATPATPQEVAE